MGVVSFFKTLFECPLLLADSLDWSLRGGSVNKRKKNDMRYHKITKDTEHLGTNKQYTINSLIQVA